MRSDEPVNILLVDDQPAKLLSYEVVLRELGENLIQAGSAQEALQILLKTDVAVVLMDVCMPDLDGFELAAMIRDHPRFQRTAIIFISAIHLTDMDHLRGYEMGAVDYVPVPVVPEVLRAKVKVFAELYRKTRQLEQLNRELEQRVAERTAELEASAARLLQSEQRRTLALAAGRMGSWDWDLVQGVCHWDAGQCGIFGVDPERFAPTVERVRDMVHPEDWARMQAAFAAASPERSTYQIEFRVRGADGRARWCIGAAAGTFDSRGRMTRASGVTVDITDRKEAEERQSLLAREVDHRARNALAVVQAVIRLTRARNTREYVAAVEGRINALAHAHTLLSQSRWQGADIARLVDEELAAFRMGNANRVRIEGPETVLPPAEAQTLTLALHELATNAAKYGALSADGGEVCVSWRVTGDTLNLDWIESGGPRVQPPRMQGFGTKILNASIKDQFGGRVDLDWAPEGLRCTLSIPYAAADAAAGLGRHGRNNGAALPARAERPRIMLVEDAALVGPTMRDALTELGFAVEPFCALDDAYAAARSEFFDVAVLDLDFGAEAICPIAELLMAQQAPIVFVASSAQASPDPCFAHIPRLQRPIAPEALEAALRANLGAAAKPHVTPAPHPDEATESLRIA